MTPELSLHSPAELELADVQIWNVYWAQVERRIAPVFARSDALKSAVSYLAGLLSPAERKNSWQLAEIIGLATPYSFQHLLGRADWKPDDLRDRLRAYVLDYLEDPDAVGVIDESGFLKKGRHSVGLARQYSGTAGKIENCQIGVFLTYASVLGHTLIDRELYVPEEWTDDPERCAKAGMPDKYEFATKPQLARVMLQRAFDAGVKLAWVTGDSVYGDNRELREWLEQREQAYVLALSGKESVWLEASQQRIKTILAEAPSHGWQRLSAGAGSKGARLYDWRRLELSAPAQSGWRRWLLIRRSISDPSEMTAYIVFARAQTSMAAMVRAAGARWKVEESIQNGKGEVGMDHYEVRSWNGWYRHITLAMWASAFLSVIREETGAQAAPKKGLWKQEQVSSLAEFKARRKVL